MVTLHSLLLVLSLVCLLAAAFRAPVSPAVDLTALGLALLAAAMLAPLI